ncbi:hypothetical protein VTK26DRAFT_4893 [Humicola hyalothermophila]
MGSSSGLQSPGFGQPNGGSPIQFGDLPVETIIEILSYVDFVGLDNMLRVNRRLRRIIEGYWSSILPEILDREFSPAEGFLQALQDVFLPLDDLGGGDASSAERDLRSHSLDFAVLCNDGSLGLPSTKRLHSILAFCRTVKRWEVEFQRQRFFHYPEYSRSLRPHELGRLRHGLYVWWRFARYFHGGAPFGNKSHPTACHQTRRSAGLELERRFMWQFSTAQLHDILDMWETVRSAVGREVCPSVSVVSEWLGYALPTAEVARIGWGDGVENEQILSTIMKLRPEDLLHLLVYRHRYTTRRSVVDFVKLRNPRIDESMETFRDAILEVLIERDSEHIPGGNFLLLSGFPDRDGGVLDHDEAGREELRDMLSHDAAVGGPQYAPSVRYLDADVASLEVRPGRLTPSS